MSDLREKIRVALEEVEAGHGDSWVRVTAADLVTVRAMGAALDSIVGALAFHRDGTQGPTATLREIQGSLDRLYEEHPAALSA